MNQKRKFSSKESLSKNSSINIQEYLVEIFGSLMPGIMCFIGIIFSLIIPMSFFIKTLMGDVSVYTSTEIIINFLLGFKEIPTIIISTLILFCGSVCYIIGFLFYRQDLEKLNKKSFRRIENNYNKKIKEQNERTKKLKKNWACANTKECKFPYPSLYDYFKSRKLNHLLPLVCKKRGEPYKSILHINMLKNRLRFYFPDKCSLLIRNEAHIRLSASVWGVAGFLFYFGLVGITLWVTSIFLLLHLHQISFHCSYKYISPVISPVSILVLYFFVRKRIEHFFHYLRLREIFFIFETAYIASLDHEEIVPKSVWKEECEKRT